MIYLGLYLELKPGSMIFYIINKNGEVIKQFRVQQELRINTFYTHKQQHKFTFENIK